MKRTENAGISSHLDAERDRLLNAIAQIRKAGSIADLHCWLSELPETKGNATYTYVQLRRQPPGEPLRCKSLGKPGSERHRNWKKAIARRDAIAELEQQLQIIEALIDRQILTAQQVAIAAHSEESAD